MTEWNREKVKKVLDVLKQLPDFDRVPLPHSIHKEFDIPFHNSKSGNVMDYFQRYMDTQKINVGKVEVIDGTIVHKDVVFPTSILENYKIPQELQLDNGEQPRVIHHEKDEQVFSNDLSSSSSTATTTLPTTEECLSTTTLG